MINVTVDTSEIQKLAVTLESDTRQTAKGVRPIVAKGALNIKNQLVKEARASKHFRGFAPAISYTLANYAGGASAEIGPVKGSPGSLANIAYFGTSRGGGTVPAPWGALEAETPNVEAALLRLVRGL